MSRDLVPSPQDRSCRLVLECVTQLGQKVVEGQCAGRPPPAVDPFDGAVD